MEYEEFVKMEIIEDKVKFKVIIPISKNYHVTIGYYDSREEATKAFVQKLSDIYLAER